MHHLLGGRAYPRTICKLLSELNSGNMKCPFFEIPNPRSASVQFQLRDTGRIKRATFYHIMQGEGLLQRLYGAEQLEA